MYIAWSAKIYKVFEGFDGAGPSQPRGMVRWSDRKGIPMTFLADFHIHSRFSRATSKTLDLEHLHIAAQCKGVAVVGTGDATHPGWFAEIKEKLIPAEPGMFKLKDEISRLCDQEVPKSCRRKVRFMLVSEISNIYKKNNKTRKNHNLVFLSDLNQAENFNSKLDKIGNIKSDGRPILGLDARDLLEILLETSEKGFLIPAHIWTPWFSLLGSKSGFDSIEECFEDLSSYIFAVETGLSSDPAMNWRVSFLDGLTLVSNSDAHSPLKLGREANIFNTRLSYSSIKKTIKKGDPESFIGTYEFYPEEGKYHIDGHRKCNISFWPEQTRNHNGICPVCGKPLTLGVLYRVEELSDRLSGETPEKNLPFFNIIPLTSHICSLTFKISLDKTCSFLLFSLLNYTLTGQYFSSPIMKLVVLRYLYLHWCSQFPSIQIGLFNKSTSLSICTNHVFNFFRLILVISVVS